MGYKIQFESGKQVEFESKPTDADIDEAFNQLHPKKEAVVEPTFMDKAKGVANSIGDNIPEPLKNAFGGIESVARMIPNIVPMAYNYGIDKTGEFIKDPKLQETYQELAKDARMPMIEPFTEAGAVADEMLGEGFKTVARAPGAAVQAAISGGDQTKARELMRDPHAVGPMISQIPIEVAGIIAGAKALPGQAKGLSQFVKNPMGEAKTPQLSTDAKIALELREKAKKSQIQEEQVGPSNYMEAGEFPSLNRQLSEAGLIPDFVRESPEQPLPFVPELYKEEAPRITGKTKTFDPTIPEAERLAAARVAELSKPLPFERTPIEPQITDYVPQEPGLPFTVENKLSTPVEVARASRDVQGGMRDVAELTGDVNALREQAARSTELGPEQQMAIQGLEHDLANAQGRTAAGMETATQVGRDLGQLKIDTGEGPRTPTQIKSAPSPSRPAGQTQAGKGQRGSIGFFGKSPFVKFSENLKKEIPDITPEEVQAVWDKKQSINNREIRSQERSPDGGNYRKFGDLPAEVTGEVWSPEKAIDILKTTSDITNDGFFKEKTASSGRLQRDLFNHPATTWIYNLATDAIESAHLASKQTLHDNNTGILNQIRRVVRLSPGGSKAMRDYMRWRFDNEGTGAVPKDFPENIQAIHENLNKADKTLLDKMNETLVADGKKPIKGLDNHMVHYWNGPYRSYIYVKTPEGGSRLAYFVAEKSVGEAKKAIEWIKKNVPNVDLEKTKDPIFVKANARNRSGMFDHLLNLANEKDPVVSQAMESFKNSIASAQEKHLGEQHRQDYRVGVKGYLGEKPWKTDAANYVDAIESIREKFDAGYEWIAAQKIRQQMEPVLKAQQDGTISVGNAIGLGQKYVDHVLGKDVDTGAITAGMDYLESKSPRMVGGTRRGINILNQNADKVIMPWLLALKGTQMVQAVLQVPQAAIPKMLELQQHYKVSPAKAAYDMPTSLAMGVMDGLLTVPEMINPRLRAHGIVDAIKKSMGMDASVGKAITDYMQKNDIADMSLSDAGYSKEGGVVKTIANDTADLFLNKPLQFFENPTRTMAFSAYTRQALKAGYKLEDALQIAKESMDSMVNYNPEASAMGLADLGGVGREARGLHTFQINYYTQLAKYIQMAKRNPKNAGPMLAYLGMTFAMAGAVGMIGVDIADALHDMVKLAIRGTDADSPDIQKWSARSWLMQNTPDTLSVGPLSSKTGLGLYGSFTTKIMDPDRTALDNFFPKTQAKLGLLGAFAKTPKLLSDNTTEKERGNIIEAVSPKFLTQTIRNKYQNKDNIVYDPSPNRAGLPTYQRTPKEQKISEKGLGVRGLAEVMGQEEMIHYYKSQKNLNDSQKLQLNKLDNLVVAGIKSGENITPFQQQAINNKVEELTKKWQIDPKIIEAKILSSASAMGVSDAVVQKLMQFKNVKLKDVQKIDDLTGISYRQQQRKQAYGGR